MEPQITVAIVGVGAALTGSAIGGITSYLSTRSMRRIEWNLAQKEKEISRREILYAEFITEANRLVIMSVQEKLSDGKELATLFALESRIWLHSERIGPLARKVAGCILNFQGQQEKKEQGSPTFGTLRDEFITACRNDLANVRNEA